MSFACEYLIYSVSKSGFLKRLKFFMVLLVVTIFFIGRTTQEILLKAGIYIVIFQ